jgi:ribonuclease D
LDLSTFARNFGFVPGIGATGLVKYRWSLKDLAARFLSVNVSKDERLAQWSNPQLEPASLLYAAVDVYIGRKVNEAIISDASPLLKEPPLNSS